MTTPLIGITTYGRNDDNHYTLPAEYVEAVRRAGGIPILIPPGESRNRPLLTMFDAFILAGGGDIASHHYGGQQHPTMYMVDSERDESELALARLLTTQQIPTLGICRGIQTLNVALGGTLVEHVPDEFHTIIHRNPAAPAGPPISTPLKHPVKLKPNTILHQIMGQDEVEPMSWHHQAVRQLAPGLTVLAKAADGLIEAVRLEGHPWLLAVQWHPELTAATDPTQQALFNALVEAARRYQQTRGND